ncbi:hypothetical protein HZH68_017014 [Vespula germanica]|uniref:Uncharacterized protein n=1 Tax=Vespula germanica TaxID=30212 RepID=A0A834J228_VESGE|nr:hypothetical protein HZH68_017014 [Vespula germanica]
MEVEGGGWGGGGGPSFRRWALPPPLATHCSSLFLTLVPSSYSTFSTYYHIWVRVLEEGRIEGREENEKEREREKEKSSKLGKKKIILAEFSTALYDAGTPLLPSILILDCKVDEKERWSEARGVRDGTGVGIEWGGIGWGEMG